MPERSCQVCTEDLSSRSASNATRHENECLEKVKKFGGYFPERTNMNIVKKAMAMSRNIDKTLIHTSKELEKLKLAAGGHATRDQTGSNVTVVLEAEKQMYMTKSGEKRVVRSVNDPNLGYQYELLDKAIDSLPLASSRFGSNPESSRRKTIFDDDYDADSDEDREIMINGIAVNEKKATKIREPLFLDDDDQRDDKINNGLDKEQIAVGNAVVDFFADTYFNRDHPENHSIRLRNKKLPNTTLQILQNGHWLDIAQQLLYKMCLENSIHQILLILEESPFITEDINTRAFIEILKLLSGHDVDPSDIDTAKRMKEKVLEGIGSTIRNGLPPDILMCEPNETHELFEYNLERCARKENNERYRNLDQDEVEEIKEIAKERVRAKRLGF